MSYNLGLQSNNIQIQNLISKASNMPEAGEKNINDVSKRIIDGTLTTLIDNAITQISDYAFAHCHDLQLVDLTACKNIDYRAFHYCSNLTFVNFPACSAVGAQAFQGCSKLVSISFPTCTTINNTYAFGGCESLTFISFPACTSIGLYAFANCRRLSSLTLGASTICALANSSAFNATPFAGYSSYFSGTPHIYVPSSLITTYQAATNWIYFSSYFSSIESMRNMITFAIDGIEYRAEEGMIWEEWLDSEYNVDGYYADYDGAVYKAIEYSNYVDYYHLYGNDGEQTESMQITSGESYSWHIYSTEFYE